MKPENPFLALLSRWQGDPEAFVREAFGAEPEAWQGDVLGAYGAMVRGEDERRGISIGSCNGAGKTTLVAWLAWHNLLCFAPSRTTVTAPSKPQAFDAFFPEFAHWGDKLTPAVRSLVEITGEGAFLKSLPHDAFLVVKTARKENPESVQGVHTEEGRILVLVDEGSGVDDDAYLALRGLTSGARAVMVIISNPTRRSGFFYETHHSLKGLWYTKQIAWTDSSRTSKRFEEEQRLTYGVESNEYRVFCLGQFPTQDDDTIIPFDLIDAACHRDIRVAPDQPVVWGLDVARSINRDASALCKRRGNVVLEPVKSWHLDDGMVLAGAVANEYRETPARDRPVEILVDAIGLGGPVVDRLREVGLPARGINVGESPSFDGQDRYANLKSELWIGKARDWFMQRLGSIPAEDVNLRRGLQMPRREWDSAGSKIRIEAKEKTKAREKKPGLDEADAFVLTFASDAVALTLGHYGARNQPIKRNLKGIV